MSLGRFKLSKYVLPHDYEVFHKRRFEYILQILDSLNAENLNVLEVGVSNFSIEVYKKCRNLTTMDLCGRSHVVDEVLQNAPHILFDLQDLQRMQEYASPQKYDIIIFAEVIEHLVIAPEHVMKFLHSLLSDDGKIILQTPNLTHIFNRLNMLRGVSPFDRMRPETDVGASHGHVREYTKKELIEICTAVNLKVLHHDYKNYFDSASSFRPPVYQIIKFLMTITGIVPSFRGGQTLLLVKD